MSDLKIPVSASDHIQGADSAKVTLMEYGDYQCPDCGHAHPIVKRLQAHFGDQLRFVFRHFPLSQLHEYAEQAAEAAEFAGAHGQFWKMHDGILANQAELDTPFLFEIAELLGLSGEELHKSLNERTYLAVIKASFLGGIRSGVNGTPTFFINGKRHDGATDYGDLVDAIESQLHT